MTVLYVTSGDPVDDEAHNRLLVVLERQYQSEAVRVRSDPAGWLGPNMIGALVTRAQVARMLAAHERCPGRHWLAARTTPKILSAVPVFPPPDI